MSSAIDQLLEKGKEKLKGKDAREALKFLKKHKKELNTLGKNLLGKMIAWVGLGEPEKAKDLYLIKYQSTDELIKGIEGSGKVFEDAHKKMQKEAGKINAMWKSLGIDAAKALLPLIISSL